MEAATKTRHDERSEYSLFCEYCHVGYQRITALEKHQKICGTTRHTPSTYRTPIKRADDGEAGDDGEGSQEKMGPG